MNDIEELMDAMLLETDKLALIKCEYGTPEYELQQSMIRNAASYRLARARDEKL